MSTRALQSQLTSELNKHIKKENSFYNEGRADNATDKDEIIVNESADMPGVVKNPKRFPMEINVTEDTTKTYKNNTFATKPTLISKDNELLTSFNKRANEAEKHADQLENYIAESINYEWAAEDASNIVRTSGGATGTILGAMTSTRKALAKLDFITANRILSQQGVPVSGRVMLIDIAQYYELLTIAGFTEFQLTGLTDPFFMNGKIAPMMGVTKLYLRDRVTWYDNTGTPVRQEAVSEGTEKDTMVENAPAAASNLGVHIFHPNYVRFSKGHGATHIDSGKPQYNGGMVLNSTVRAGATKARIDNFGVVSIVQAT